MKRFCEDYVNHGVTTRTPAEMTMEELDLILEQWLWFDYCEQLEADREYWA